jgi:2-polyprenyl-3-methyl-5-hydroxy-6-metoxy-1,4-benzoquinol methylase
MNASLEHIYETHHATRRGEGFVLLDDVRGAFLKEAVGTGKHVLDIGCRDGALTKSFAEGNTVLGIDIDTKALARAHESLGIETRHIDLNGEWPFEDRSFDAVVVAEILEHLYYPGVVINRISRVLVPGGIFAGTVPNAFSLVNRFRYLLKRKKGTPLEDPTHINHFTVREMQNLLEQRFTDVKVVGFGRLGWLARTFPQTFAFGLFWNAKKPLKI